jgi:hypothetical protein
MKTMLRAWFVEHKKTLVFVDPPFPAVGEVVNMPDGSQLTVKRVRLEQGFEITIPRKREVA